MSDYFVSRSRVVSATAADIFDLLADPSRHSEIDGSGSVRGSLPDAPSRLYHGAEFGMSMKIGVPYKMENRVVEFEENRRIAWAHYGGHIWRYELSPIGDGASTTVTETFDGSTANSKLLLRVVRASSRNARSIEKTLQRLAQRFETKGA
jgi:hypothetical protein